MSRIEGMASINSIYVLGSVVFLQVIHVLLFRLLFYLIRTISGTAQLTLMVQSMTRFGFRPNFVYTTNEVIACYQTVHNVSSHLIFVLVYFCFSFNKTHNAERAHMNLRASKQSSQIVCLCM